MTARRTPARNTIAPDKLPGNLIEVPAEALANEAAAAGSNVQDVEAPADEVTNAIADLATESNGTTKTPLRSLRRPQRNDPWPSDLHRRLRAFGVRR